MIKEMTVGETIPISIGTAIPLESILTGQVDKPNGSLYINIRTLFRNLHGAIKDTDVNVKDYVSKMVDEIGLLGTLNGNSLNAKINIQLYITTYNTIGKQLPLAKHKQAKTVKQKRYQELETHVIEMVLNKVNTKEDTVVEIYDGLINGNNTKALLISHLPLDLLSVSRFKSLRLLESHTGVVKTKPTWITKITKNADYVNIPFNELSIQLLGDGNNLLSALGSRAMLKEIHTIAVKNKWSPATTKAKQKYDIRKLSDKGTGDMLIKLLNSKLK